MVEPLHAWRSAFITVTGPMLGYNTDLVEPGEETVNVTFVPPQQK